MNSFDNFPSIKGSICRLRDWRDLLMLMKICFPHLSREQLSDEIRNKAWASWIFRDGERAVGYWSHNNFRGPKIAWSEQSCVHPDYRGQGLGKMILLHYEQFAKWVGFEELGGSVLKTNTQQIANLKRLEWTWHRDKTDERYLVLKRLEYVPFEDRVQIEFKGLERKKDRFLKPYNLSIIDKVFYKICYLIMVDIGTFIDECRQRIKFKKL